MKIFDTVKNDDYTTKSKREFSILGLTQYVQKQGFRIEIETPYRITEPGEKSIWIYTNKSMSELNRLGIYTPRDILGDYFLFVRFEAFVGTYEEFCGRSVFNPNKKSFLGTYFPRFNNNANIIWSDKYIYQITVLIEDESEYMHSINGYYSDLKYIIYRDSGVLTKLGRELTENEKLFVRIGQEHLEKVNASGVTSCMLNYDQKWAAYHVLSKDSPLLVE